MDSKDKFLILRNFSTGTIFNKNCKVLGTNFNKNCEVAKIIDQISFFFYAFGDGSSSYQDMIKRSIRS